MSATTRYQAVREALCELGPLATVAEVAAYVKQYHKYEFRDTQALSVYIAMVQRKMSRKPLKDSMTPSGMFSVPGQ